MKSLLLTGLMVVSLGTMAQLQKHSAIADPKLGQITITDMAGHPIDADNVRENQPLKLRVPVSNMNGINTIPIGSSKIKIGLGSKLRIDPAFNMNSAGLGNIFNWSFSEVGGQTEILGDLVGEFPADVQDIFLTFRVKGNVLGTSTITANFLVTNHNTRTILSDEDGNNNASYLQYTVQSRNRNQPVIKINQMMRGACSVNLTFGTDDESTFSRYDIEASINGTSFVKVGEVAVNGDGSYRTSFQLTPALETQSLVVRVKSVDHEGRYIYSQPQTISGICENNNPWVLNVYPNPATNVKAVTISATQGMFNGKYKVNLMDMQGQLIQSRQMTLDRVTNFRYEFGHIAGGKYVIEVVNFDGSQSGALKFEKL